MLTAKHTIRFLLVMVTAGLVSCQNNRNEVMALGKKEKRASQTGKDITMLYTDSTLLRVKLEAPEMEIYDKDAEEKTTVMPKGVFVVFYNDKGKESTTLKADYGIRYENSKRMEVKYNVEVVNENGEKLNTEHLIWDEQTKKIRTDAFVKITTAREIIMGKGLEANQDFTQYQITEITGTLRVDEQL